MIIGGTGGASVTGDGGLVTGYEETFFPCVVTIAASAIDAAYTGNKAIRYSASARIRNVADDAWVDLADVTSFQVSADSDGGGTASITVRKPETWSIDGTNYPDLLRPSQRILQVFCTITISGASYTVPVFVGQITNYNESHGQRGGAISLTARISTIALQNRPSAGYTRETAYRRIVDEVKASGLFSAGQVPVILFNDYALSSTTTYRSLLAMIEGVSPVVCDISTRQTGGLMIAPKGEATSEQASFTIQDSNQAAITRSLGSATSYNTITVIGTSGGEVVSQTVSDATDVSRRGTVKYPWNYGTSTRALADNVADAEDWLAEMLRGKLSATIQLNPFIEIGTILTFDSDRLFLSNGTARVGAYTHQYSVGKADTTISDVAVLA